MKLIIISIILIVIFNSFKVQAQWPGYFYAFVLKDVDGNIIDSSSSNYKMTTVKSNDSSEVLLGIEICVDNKTWRFYEGAVDFDKINKLKIEKIENGNESETMIIEFPPSLSGGKEKYYRDLYIGEIKFKKGIHRVKLPQTGNQWDELKEIKLCPDGYNNYTFHDISKYQK